MTGISWKLSCDGGDGMVHSSVFPPHGFAGAFLPLKIDRIKFAKMMMRPIARNQDPIVESTWFV
jgi:hypothetical protein